MKDCHPFPPHPRGAVERKVPTLTSLTATTTPRPTPVPRIHAVIGAIALSSSRTRYKSSHLYRGISAAVTIQSIRAGKQASMT